MSFVYPSFLFALFALAIPLIIHLFNFRRFKKIYFTNVRFLKEVKQETQSQSKLKHLVVLLTRILALSFLVFAFSQPYIKKDKDAPVAAVGRQVGIFIDNSFSMDAVNDNGRLFDQARQIAEEIANAYQPADLFHLLTNDFESRHQRLIHREELSSLIDETEISASSKKISEVIARMSDVSPAQERIPAKKTFFILSDFQKSSSDLQKLPADTSIEIRLVPIQPSLRNNLYIDTCWFESPVRKLNTPDQLHVRIINKSEIAYENVPVKFTVNGQLRTLGTTISIASNTRKDTVLNFTSTQAGFQNAVVEITDYPVTFDDKFFLSYQIAEKLHILSIFQKDTNSYIKSLFNLPEKADSSKENGFSLEFSSSGRINYSSFVKKDMIILSDLDSISSGLAQELKKFIENGGSLFIFPSPRINYTSYKDFLSSLNINYFETADSVPTSVSEINFDHAIYRYVFDFSDGKAPSNLDLPLIHKEYRLSSFSQTNEEWLMRTRKGNTMLGRYSYGNGLVYLSSVPLGEEFSNFPKHALFVPTLYQAALHSRETGKLYYSLAEDDFVEIIRPAAENSGKDNIYHIVAEDRSLDFIPETRAMGSHLRFYIHGQILKAGNYSVVRGEETTGTFSFNYDRRESVIEVYDPAGLKQQIAESGLQNIALLDADVKMISRKVTEISEGIKLWKYCVILALIFLVTETLLLRWWK